MSIKGQGHSLTLVKGHSDFNVKICFSQKQLGNLERKIHMKAWGRKGMKIYTNELGHMTNMAAMPIYGKNLKKSSTPEPLDPWSWKLVCSIVYGSTVEPPRTVTSQQQPPPYNSQHLISPKCSLLYIWPLHSGHLHTTATYLLSHGWLL